MIHLRRLFSSLRRVAPDIGALLLLLVLVAFFFWRLWAPNQEDWLRFPKGDFTEQYYPLRHFVAATLAEGQLPFWNPYIFGGQPGLADPQAAVLYPPALLNALFSYKDASQWADNFPLEALELEAIAHIALAACGTYLFVRLAVRLGVIPALVAAIIFGFGGYLTSFSIQQLMILESIAWLPWLLLTHHYAVSHQLMPYRLVGIALAALVFGCILLAGHLQSALYLIYLSVGYAFLRLLRRQGKALQPPLPSRFDHWLLIALPLVAPFVLGVGLAAAQWLPSLAFIREASKEALEYNFVQDSASWREISGLLLPQADPSSARSASLPFYVGLLPLLLAPVGLMSKGQRAEKGFWAAAALVTLLLALAAPPTLFDLLYLKQPHVAHLVGALREAPLQEHPKGFLHVLFIWNWSIALLAAWGMATLLTMVADETQRVRMRDHVRRLTRMIPLLLLPLFALWSLRALEFAQFELDLDILTSFFDRYSFLVMILWLGWGVLAWHSHTTPSKRWYRLRFGLLLLALLLFDLFSITRIAHLGPKAENSLIRQNDVVDTLLALPEESLRVGIIGQPHPRRNEGMYWRIPLLSGKNSLRLENSEKLFQHTTLWQQLQFLGANYIVADSDLAESYPDRFELLESDSSSHLLRTRPAMPYIWVVEQTEVISNQDELYRRLQDHSFDPHLVALLEDVIPALASPATSVGQLTLEQHAAGFAQVRISNSADKALLLIFAEPSANGWQLFIDEEPQSWIRANGFNISALVPPGEHLVTLRYEQPGWQTGLIISGTSLVVVLLMLAVGMRGVAVGAARLSSEARGS